MIATFHGFANATGSWASGSSMSSRKSSLAIHMRSSRRRRAALHRRLARKHQPEGGPALELRIEGQLSPKTPRDEGMNDVKSQSRSALAAPGREKWVEGLVADLIGHSDSVVGNDHLNMFGVQGTGL